MHSDPVLLTGGRVGLRVQGLPEEGVARAMTQSSCCTSPTCTRARVTWSQVTRAEKAGGTETGRLAGSHLVYHRIGTMLTPSTVT